LCLWRQIFPADTVTGGALRWVTDIGVVLLMGSAAQSLTSSGAFEIYFNGTCHAVCRPAIEGLHTDTHTPLTTALMTDDLIFSKLETGRWPTLQVRVRV